MRICLTFVWSIPSFVAMAAAFAARPEEWVAVNGLLLST